jgi:hypothetical protein
MPKIINSSQNTGDGGQTSYSNVPNPISSSGRKKTSSKLLKFVNFILFLVLIIVSYAYYQSKSELDLLKNPEAQAQVMRKEAEEIIAMVSKVALLPEGDEFPEVLTIENADLAIQEQPNLTGVVTGDKILLYMKSGKAIVYSPSRNIIVNILPVVLQSPSTQPSSNTSSATNSAGTSSQNRSTSSDNQKTTTSTASSDR